jgi:hypothetical protein
MTQHREISCPPTRKSPVRGQGDQLSAQKDIPLSVDNGSPLTTVTSYPVRSSNRRNYGR